MDVLSQVIMMLREGDAFFRRTRRAGHWGNRFGPYHGAGFHLLLAGSCWFSPVAGPPVRLAAGDVLFLPRGTVHALGDQPFREFRALPDEHADGPDLGDGTPDGTVVEMLCGAYELRRRTVQPLLDAMPDHVHLPGEDGAGGGALRAATDLVDWERPGGRAGDQAVRSALLDLLLVRVLRLWIDRQTPGLPATATSDPGIMKVLQHLHETPAEAWTVARMAALSGLSRSTFTRRFTDTLGVPPLRYVGWWRLNIAARRLRQTDAPLAAIAGEVGYGSEFAFAHAFKREFGMAAGRFRRTPSTADRESWKQD